jgi:hypothetical protein
LIRDPLDQVQVRLSPIARCCVSTNLSTCLPAQGYLQPPCAPLSKLWVLAQRRFDCRQLHQTIPICIRLHGGEAPIQN